MKIRGWSYYVLLLLFPLLFLLHHINENFGITDMEDVRFLAIIYLFTAAGISVFSKLLMRSYRRAFVFAFVLLVINFFFGVYKDLAKSANFPAVISSYKYLLPLLFGLLILLAVYLRRSNRTFARFSQAIAVFLLLNVVVETGWVVYNILTTSDTHQDFGDRYQAANHPAGDSSKLRKPTVFWIVFDEYSRSSTLKRVWGFVNPLDSMLRSKGFFVADSARSNYNFTHYSFSSTLGMVYLKNLQNHSRSEFRDRRREEVALYDNNTVQIFEKNGYAINNFTIFRFRNHPSYGVHTFGFSTKQFINFQTFAGRIQSDIGWNFPTLFKPDKRRLDSMNVIKSLQDMDTAHKNLLASCLHAVRKGATDPTPAFYLFHFLLPHSPYMYNPDGSIAFKNGYHDSAQHYIPQLQYTNTWVNLLADSILSNYRGRDLVIIIQGDHAYRFAKEDPLFDFESCNILYAVYCSDGDYSPWSRSHSAVNSFRILFNKYFHTGLPLLPDSSFMLYEH